MFAPRHWSFYRRMEVKAMNQHLYTDLHWYSRRFYDFLMKDMVLV